MCLVHERPSNAVRPSACILPNRLRTQCVGARQTSPLEHSFRAVPGPPPSPPGASRRRSRQSEPQLPRPPAFHTHARVADLFLALLLCAPSVHLFALAVFSSAVVDGQVLVAPSSSDPSGLPRKILAPSASPCILLHSNTITTECSVLTLNASHTLRKYY